MGHDKLTARIDLIVKRVSILLLAVISLKCRKVRMNRPQTKCEGILVRAPPMHGGIRWPVASFVISLINERAVDELLLYQNRN
jgi:hypothetical protein